MKDELRCSVVEDLLPSFVDHLTSEETNALIKTHLAGCPSCAKSFNAMEKHVMEEKTTREGELKFFQKIHRRKLLGAVISVILALSLAFGIYTMEFRYTLDKESLSGGIGSYLGGFEKYEDFEPYVLEVRTLPKGRAVVSFKDLQDERTHGLVGLIKGFNGRYRMVQASVEASDLSAVIHPFSFFQMNGQAQVMLSGFNLPSEVASYGLRVAAYTEEGWATEKRVETVLPFTLDNLQFLEVLEAEEVMEKALEGFENPLYHPSIVDAVMYDAQGRDITDTFLLEEPIRPLPRGGISTAELGLVYVYMFLVLGFGAIMVRYFLTD